MCRSIEQMHDPYVGVHYPKFPYDTVKSVLTTTFLKRLPVLNDHLVVLP